MPVTNTSAAADLARVTAAIADAAVTLGRSDLGARLSAASSRATRPATVVCVVGEFKQGKSSLVNALIGDALCPVDDDLATSVITLVYHGPEISAQVRRRRAGELVVESIDPATIADWVTESGNPANEKAVERVDIATPSELLAHGLVLVDTPGMGGLGAGHAAATLAFLPFADGLIFVSDASSELSEPEITFLTQAREACPNVMMALTRTDLYGHWREIEARNRRYLGEGNGAATILPVSSALRVAAEQRGDIDLDAQSGIPELLAELDRQIVAPAKRIAVGRAAIEAVGSLDQLDSSVAAELAALDDPARGAAIVAEASAAQQRIEHLRGPGSRWTTVVGDRIADLSNDVNFQFRDAMRHIVRSVEEQIEQLKTAEQWDELGRRLQTGVATTVADAFTRIETGATGIRDAVLDLLADDIGEIRLPSVGSPLDVTTLWSSKPIEINSTRHGKVAGTALTGLRGAQSGIMMFGMMGQFMPAGVAVLLASNPVTLGLGAVFGGYQLMEGQKRKVAQRRQQARVNARQFSDDVQFEVSNTIGELLRTIQRAIRDEFADRIAELHRTCADTIRAANEAITLDAAGRARRSGELQASLQQLAQHRANLSVAIEAFQ